VHALALGTADLAVFTENRTWKSHAGERFLAEHPDHGDRLPILAHEVPAAKAMAQALLEHPVARLGLTGGQPEQALFADDDRFGVWRRCKVDYLAPAAGGRLILTDIKTTEDASPAGFAKSAAKYGYHRQAANCAWLARRLGLARHATMIFAAGEKLHAAPEKMPDAQELHCFREAGEPPTGILVSEAKMEIALDIQMLE
jgi:hypothetical protein